MGNSTKTPLGARLKAWWNGDDLASVGDTVSGEDAAPGGVGETRARPIFYEDSEIDACQKIWGEGRCAPLSGAFLRSLYAPIALDETKSVLLIGAGMGDLARQLHTETNAYVTGFEADPRLAQAGMALSKRLGLGKEATVESFDPENMVLDRRYDAIIALCELSCVRAKGQSVETIAAAIKPQSHIHILDFAVADGAQSQPEVKAWLAAERREPFPWSPGEFQSALKDVGFTLRTVEDHSKAFEKAALEGFNTMLSLLPASKSSDAVKKYVLFETELWVRRLMALQSGGLRVVRALATTDPTFNAK